jgi:hypothetical protein
MLSQFVTCSPRDAKTLIHIYSSSMLIASQVLPKLFVLMDAARAFKLYDESINVVNVIYDSAVSFDA